MGNGRFVPWERLALGDLAAPTQPPQELPEMGGVIPHPEVHLDHGREAPQGPELVGKAMRSGTLQSEAQHLLALRLRQLARPSGPRLGGQGRLAAGLPGLPPLVDGSDRRVQPARHFAQAQTVLQQREGSASAPLYHLG